MDSEITHLQWVCEDAATSPRVELPGGDFVEPPTALWDGRLGSEEEWLDTTTPLARSPRDSSAPPPPRMSREQLQALARTVPARSGRQQPVDELARTTPSDPRLRVRRASSPPVVSSAPSPDRLERTRTAIPRDCVPQHLIPRARGSRPPLADPVYQSGRIQPTELAPGSNRPEDDLPDISHDSLDIGDSTSLLVPGFELGNYLIRRQIAKGGMGVVYEAEHRYLRRRVAIKVLRQSRLNKPEVVRRFFREAVAATRIGHAGVVEVIDYGHAPAGGAYLVMELLCGQNLADRLDQRERLSVHEAIDIGRAIADIVAAAHAAGIVHRDLKPDNIFLSRGEDEYELEQVKVLDFGVAKFLQANDGNKTKFGKLLGTPYYMSPEQCEGRQEVDHRSDIYSLGCLLFEMLTGRCPFAGHTVDVLIAHRRTAPPSVRDFNPQVPAEIDALIQQMLAKRPEQRPQSMAQVVAELTLVERSHSGSIDAPVAVPVGRYPSGDVSPDAAGLIRIPRYQRTLDKQRRRGRFWKRLLLFTAGLALTAAAATTVYLTVWNGKLPF